MENVSVVIAVYNAEHYIETAIESVLQQTYTDWHLYVVDDGSTDGTPDKLKLYFDNPKITLARQENSGQASAKNRGAFSSQSQFIAFLDADDWWEPEKLSSQLSEFSDPVVGVVYCDYKYVDRHGQVSKDQPGPVEHPTGNVIEALLVRNFVPFGTSVIRREAFADNGGFDDTLEMGIDWNLWLHVSRFWKFAFIDEEHLNYRVWEGQMSNNLVGRYDCAFRILRAFVRSNPTILSKRTVRRAFSDTFAHRARARRLYLNEYIGAYRDSFAAIYQDPTYAYAWRTLGKILLKK